ncbi:hypothetical protein [Streptomyces sp. NPDC046859]|uniref:hypothetical protein n=1 Tax=Streptomyces sp. NPDC046859 TaxID=3155734 RepID=UPI0033D39797
MPASDRLALGQSARSALAASDGFGEVPVQADPVPVGRVLWEFFTAEAAAGATDRRERVVGRSSFG